MTAVPIFSLYPVNYIVLFASWKYFVFSFSFHSDFSFEKGLCESISRQQSTLQPTGVDDKISHPNWISNKIKTMGKPH